MIFKRSIKFYASHRNQHLNDKCSSLHGHRYQIDYSTEVKRGAGGNGFDITTLFSDFEGPEAEVIRCFDHSTMIDIEDPLADVLVRFALTDRSSKWRITLFRAATSAENLATFAFTELNRLLSGRVQELSLRETDSTLITMEAAWWRKDLMRFSTTESRWPVKIDEYMSYILPINFEKRDVWSSHLNLDRPIIPQILQYYHLIDWRLRTC